MIDFELLALIRVLKTRNLDYWNSLRPEFFINHKNVYEFIEQYKRKNGVLPSAEFVVSALGVLVEDDESLTFSFLYDYLEERFIFNTIKVGLDRALSLLEKGRPREARDYLSKLLSNVQGVGFGAESLGGALLKLRDDYEDGRLGRIKKYELFWREFNNINGGGVLPGELFVLVARPGMLKTWFLLMNAFKLWLNGFKVLFVSPEMNTISISRRFVTLAAGLSFNAIKSYSLNDEEYQTLNRFVNTLVDKVEMSERFLIVADGFDNKVTSVGAYIERHRPDVVLIDALYLLRPVGFKGSFWEQVKMVVDEIKRMAVFYNIPIIVTTQLNRAASIAEITDLSQVAFSDAIVQDADYVFSLESSEYMPNIDDLWGGDIERYQTAHFRAFKLRPLKVRDGLVGYHLDLNISFTHYGLYVVEALMPHSQLSPNIYYLHGYDTSRIIADLVQSPKCKTLFWGKQVNVLLNNQVEERGVSDDFVSGQLNEVAKESDAVDDDKIFGIGLRPFKRDFDIEGENLSDDNIKSDDYPF